MDNGSQFIMLSVGILLGQDDPNLDMNTFKDLEELRNFLNNKYGINIMRGMTWDDVLTEVKDGIAKKRFNDAMAIV